MVYDSVYWKKYYSANRARLIAYYRRYYLRNRSNWPTKYSKPYYTLNRDQIIPQVKTWRWQVRIKAVKRLGGICVDCGETDLRVLQINHKNGGGFRELRTRQIQFYMEVAEGKRADVDLRCANCNIRYEYERGKRSVYGDERPSIIRVRPQSKFLNKT